jgi:pimeloyl-ACP methyl ester carboxylesterase
MSNQNAIQNNEPIIIILHGWGHNATLWSGISSKLKNSGYQVIIEDLPGFGSRINQAIDFKIPDYANWFSTTFEKYFDRDIILIGHSLGGRIAIELAKDNPKWLSKLILIGTPGIYEPDLKTRTIKKLSFLKQIPMLRSLASTVNSEYELAKLTNLKGTYQSVVSYNQKDILHLIKVPTLLIWGKQDFVVPIAIAKKMNNLILVSKLEVISNCGHSPQIDNPNLLFGVIKRFL